MINFSDNEPKCIAEYDIRECYFKNSYAKLENYQSKFEYNPEVDAKYLMIIYIYLSKSDYLVH
jgi:hypothetical protein